MDNIANMLTIIRNAQAVKKESVKAPYSKVNFGISKILKKEGRIKSVEVKKRGEKSWIIINLFYDKDGMPGIREIKRVSKPGKRIYVGYKEIPVVSQGYGFTVLSTQNGIIAGNDARKQKVGGEILCKVW